MRSLKWGALLVALAVAACGGGEEQEGTAAVEAGPEAPERPAVVQDTIRIEGMAEPITARLFETPDDFPLAFSAYVPEGMEPEFEDADEGGTAVRISADLGGEDRPRAFLHVYVYPDTVTAATALATATALMESRGVPVGQGIEPLEGEGALGAAEWPVARKGFRLQVEEDDWLVGDIAVGVHRGHPFHIMAQYPAELAEGFAPRIRMILDSWVWEDTGEPLY